MGCTTCESLKTVIVEYWESDQVVKNITKLIVKQEWG